MDFYTAFVIVRMVLLAAVAAGTLWWVAIYALGRFQFSGGSHDIDLAYLISKEDRDSLTREEYKKTEQMSYTELKKYLKERFPKSIPELSQDTDSTGKGGK